MERGTKHSCFKNLKGKLERESPNRTIFASGGLELLQMVLEVDTGWWVSEDVGVENVLIRVWKAFLVNVF